MSLLVSKEFGQYLWHRLLINNKNQVSKLILTKLHKNVKLHYRNSRNAVCSKFIKSTISKICTWCIDLAAIPNVYGCVGCLWCRRTPVTSLELPIFFEFLFSWTWFSVEEWAPTLHVNDSLKWPADTSFGVPSLFWKVNIIDTSTSSSLLFSMSQMNTQTGKLVSWEIKTQTQINYLQM